MISLRTIGSLGIIALVAGAIWWFRGLPEDEPNAAGTGAARREPPVAVLPAVAAASSTAPVSAQSSLPQALAGAVGNGEKLVPTLVKPLNWKQYPGTLNDQVEKALVTKDGKMAADLAAKLLECEQDSMVLEVEGSQGGGAARDPAFQAVRNARLQELHRHIASCQTIAGDQKQLRLQLLEAAMEQKVIGAAVQSFYLGVRRPDVLQQLALDAEQGDLLSLSQLATYKATLHNKQHDTL